MGEEHNVLIVLMMKKRRRWLAQRAPGEHARMRSRGWAYGSTQFYEVNAV